MKRKQSWEEDDKKKQVLTRTETLELAGVVP